MLLRVDPAAVHRVDQHLVDVDDLGVPQRVVGLQPGQLDDLGDQVVQPGGLHAHPAGEAPDGRLLRASDVPAGLACGWRRRR